MSKETTLIIYDIRSAVKVGFFSSVFFYFCYWLIYDQPEIVFLAIAFTLFTSASYLLFPSKVLVKDDSVYLGRHKIAGFKDIEKAGFAPSQNYIFNDDAIVFILKEDNTLGPDGSHLSGTQLEVGQWNKNNAKELIKEIQKYITPAVQD